MVDVSVLYKWSRRSFKDANGEGPWLCHWCSLMVKKIGRGSMDGNVHHIDEDLENSDASNLVIGHSACHNRSHTKGKPAPPRDLSCVPRGDSHWSRARPDRIQELREAGRFNGRRKGYRK